jgi:hypothetical protein
MKNIKSQTLNNTEKLNEFANELLASCGIKRNVKRIAYYIDEDLSGMYTNINDESDGVTEASYGGVIYNSYHLIESLKATSLCKSIFTNDEISELIKLTNDDILLNVERNDNFEQIWHFVFELIEENTNDDAFTLDVYVTVDTVNDKIKEVTADFQIESLTFNKLAHKY